MLVTCFAPNLQLLRGEKAEVVLSSLPISLGFTPRCWVISNSGKMIIIGYEEGLIQVLIYSYYMNGVLCVSIAVAAPQK